MENFREKIKEEILKKLQEEGKGQGGGTGEGPGGDCVCPKCGEVVTHQTGIPCNERKCPKCKTEMTRKK